MHSILAGRLLLNIREAAFHPAMLSEIGTLTTLIFGENLRAGTAPTTSVAEEFDFEVRDDHLESLGAPPPSNATAFSSEIVTLTRSVLQEQPVKVDPLYRASLA